MWLSRIGVLEFLQWQTKQPYKFEYYIGTVAAWRCALIDMFSYLWLLNVTIHLGTLFLIHCHPSHPLPLLALLLRALCWHFALKVWPCDSLA